MKNLKDKLCKKPRNETFRKVFIKGDFNQFGIMHKRVSADIYWPCYRLINLQVFLERIVTNE